MLSLRQLTHPRAPDEPRYFYTVDLFRGVAALVVVTFHYCNFYIAPDGLHTGAITQDKWPLYAGLWPIYNYGEFAVQFFWMISGFVFADVYAGKIHTTREFLSSRVSRLYPLHLLTLIVVSLLQFGRLNSLGDYAIYHDNNIYSFFLHLIMASGWGFGQELSFNAPIWSVSTELLIYAIFWTSLPYVFSRGMIGPTVMALVFSCGSIFNFPLTVFWQCGFYFFSGSAAFMAVNAAFPRNLFICAGVSGLVLSSLMLLDHVSSPGSMMPLLLISVFAIICGLPEIRFGKVVGETTYGMYLWHVPIQLVILWVADGWFGSRLWINSPLFLLGFLVSVVCAGRLSIRWIERPSRAAILYLLQRKSKNVT